MAPVAYGMHLEKLSRIVLSSCNLSHINIENDSFYSACCLQKLHKFPFHPYESVYTKPFELVHRDLWGPSPTYSSNGYKYYIYFVTSYTWFTWIYMLKNRSDAFQIFLNFKK